MAMGKKRKRDRQASMWVATADLPTSAGHPFYARLNRVLDDAGFDTFVEAQCARFYADGIGRPSLAPGRYFRLLLLGYFEGLDSEPDRGRRNWTGKAAARRAVYANRRRIRGPRGQRLLRQRGERLERPNAHLYDTGGMRRVHLRGHPNILKRLLVQVCGFNLGLLMRQLTGVGTPRSLQGRAAAAFGALIGLLRRSWGRLRPPRPLDPEIHRMWRVSVRRHVNIGT